MQTFFLLSTASLAVVLSGPIHIPANDVNERRGSLKHYFFTISLILTTDIPEYLSLHSSLPDEEECGIKV
jgi:hypothetical protein